MAVIDEAQIRYYEGHITLEPGQAEKAKAAAESYGWHVSEIAGDEVLGDRRWVYCSRSHVDLMEIRDSMASLSRRLQNDGLEVRRCKIEAVIYDRRLQ